MKKSLLNFIDLILTSQHSTIINNDNNKTNKTNKYNVFKSIGVYSIFSDKTEYQNVEDKHFYEISFRSFFFYDKLICVDIIFNDISEIRQTQSKKTELQIKENMFCKIAHEFKTPLITITSQLESLNDKVNSIKQLNLYVLAENSMLIESNNFLVEIEEIAINIKNYSHYTNFLIQDIIYYSSSSSNYQLNLTNRLI